MNYKLPYEELEGFGLSQEMIDDLPQSVQETLLSGGRSPLLPIDIPVKFGSVTCLTKFRLIPPVDGGETFGVVFYPKLKEAPLEGFTDEEKKQLLDGKVILADVEMGGQDDENSRKEKCYVQIDRDTNHVFYVHTPVIGRNIKGIDASLSLTADEVQTLADAGTVTIQEPELMTIGIDLFTDAGVFVCGGDEQNWHRVIGKRLPKYSFGLDGCWINEEGSLRYVREEDFDEEIEYARNEITRKNQESSKAQTDEQAEHIARHASDSEDDNPQLTR